MKLENPIKKQNKNVELDLFGLLDVMCSDVLQIPLNDYINISKKTTEKRLYIIVNGLLSEDDIKIVKAKKCFKLIK